MRHLHVSVLLVYLLMAGACGGDEEPSNNDISKYMPNKEGIEGFYNNAYQEGDGAKDPFETIIENAQNCYLLVDPFDETIGKENHTWVPSLKTNGNQVGAYISIGTGEDFRDDFDALKPYLVEKAWDEWNDEFFVDQVSEGLLDIMKKRIDKIAEWEFDWVEFDNMDWAFDSKNRRKYDFRVTEAEAIAYYQELKDYAHSKGLKVMAKNLRRGAEDFDGVLFESFCGDLNGWEHQDLHDFLAEAKPAIINHYCENDCDGIHEQYQAEFGTTFLFICQVGKNGAYRHY